MAHGICVWVQRLVEVVRLPGGASAIPRKGFVASPITSPASSFMLFMYSIYINCIYRHIYVSLCLYVSLYPYVPQVKQKKD